MDLVLFLEFPCLQLTEIRKATEEDETLHKLMIYIKRGWPTQHKDVEENVRIYYDFKEELICDDGIIIKGDKLVVPRKLRRNLLGRATLRPFRNTVIEIEKDRVLRLYPIVWSVTYELADLQRCSQLSVVFGTKRLWRHLVLLYNLHSLLCRYYVLTIVFQPLLEKAGGWLHKQPVPEESQFQMRYAVFVRALPLSL